jgi:fatty acid desaturase
MLKKFRTDPNYLTKYHVLVASILLGINTALVVVHPPEWQGVLWFLPAILLMTSADLRIVMVAVGCGWIACMSQADFSGLKVLALIPAVLLTFPFTSWIHSPSHGSIRPKWLNRPLGELAGLIQLAGFPDWTVIHVFHHQYPDHPELDPHPPLQKTYWEFALTMRAQVGKAFINHYFKLFGQNATSMRRLKIFMLAAKVDTLMKLTFWYLVLGPQLFGFFFLPSILFKMLHYAWFNHSTHKMNSKGEYEIRNYNHFLYRWANYLTAGLYYHENHHANPNHHNPKYIPEQQRTKLSKSA